MSKVRTIKLTEKNKKLVILWLEDARRKIDGVMPENTEQYKEKNIALEEIEECIDILKGKKISLTPFELLHRPI